MRDGWRKVTWGQVSELKYGRALRTYRSQSGTVEVFGTNGPVGWTDSASLSDGPRPVVGRKGAYRGVHLAKGPFWVIDTAYWLEPEPDLDPLWAYYKLLTVDINGMDSGSAIPSLTRTHFDALPLLLPPIDEQRRIAGALTALDDLIDANRRIAEDCTALWRAIVRDALANASESAPLSELADFVNGKNFTKGASGRGRPVIRTPEVRRGPESGTVRSGVDAAEENIAREGDTLFVWSGSLTVGRWMWEEGLINQHVFKVLPKQDVPAWLVFALIEHQMPWFLSLAADKATTMGHIKREHLDAVVPVPLPTEIKRLAPIVEPLWNEALQCGIAWQQLAHARDELLPLLLAGWVRVGDGAA